MNFKSLLALVAMMLILASCEDNTGTLGVEMMPTGDLITKTYKTYDVNTESYEVGDSVLARSSISYLGRFTDPETGTTIKSDFLTQFHCSEGFAFPKIVRNDSCTRAEVKLYVKSFIGDSLSSFKISIYELDKQLDPDADYYTNIDPTDYYDKDKKPITTKWFTLSDHTISDSLLATNKKNKYENITISIPNEIGTEIIRGYKKNPSCMSNTANWINSNLPLSKGLYFKLESGDGAVASIDVSQFNLFFKYYDEESKKDTTAYVQMAATEEVIQATRFENSNLEHLLYDKEATYIKCPAGIFTMAELPVEQIYAAENANDTINSAKLTFTRYNDVVPSAFKLDTPKKLLLLRLDDYLNGFFEKYLISNEITSYLTTLNENNNTYNYSNISKLITKMHNEKVAGTATENWNKVLLIPVEAIYDNNSQSPQLVKLNHDFSMSSSRLVGGEKTKVQIEIISSKFNK